MDLSGKPPETVYVGLVSFNIFNQDEIIVEFKKSYPKLWKEKGRNLTHKELIKIIDFLDKKKVRMATISFTSNDWLTLNSYYPKKGYLNAKMFGMLYFTLLRRVTFRNMKANLITCTESGINILKVHETILKLSKSQNFIFDISHSLEKLHPIIKIADYIASAGRNVKKSKLEEFSNFKISTKKDIPKSIYKKIFR